MHYVVQYSSSLSINIFENLDLEGYYCKESGKSEEESEKMGVTEERIRQGSGNEYQIHPVEGKCFFCKYRDGA